MRLYEYVIDTAPIPFEWGKHDCTTYVCNWIKVKVGRDVLSELPKWQDQRSAMRIMARMGGLEAAACKLLGPPKLSHPATGDIALLKAPHSCFGIVNGSVIMAVSASGLTTIGLSMADKVWEVKNA